MTIDCVLDLSELTLVSLIKTLLELEKSDSQSNQNITFQLIHMIINKWQIQKITYKIKDSAMIN